MKKYAKQRVMKRCPECQQGKLRLAKAGEGARRLEQRVYYCPKCYAAFTYEEIIVHWQIDARPALAVVP